MVWKAYHRLLSRHPIMVQSATAGILCGTGDLIAQQGLESKGLAAHDFRRTGRMVFFGTFFVGPAISNWYKILHRVVTLKNPVQAVTARVALDQLLFAPSALGFFFMVTGTLEGNPIQDSWKKLEGQYWNALKANYYIWPAIQVVNFYLVPMHYQSILVNSVSVVWNAYLSQLNQRGQDEMLAAKKIQSNP